MHELLIIGCGSIGERHLRCFQLTGRARVTGCDASPAVRKRITRAYGVPVTGDWQRAVAGGGFDAAVICTPAHQHVAMARQALRHGLHVLIEKPLSQSLAGVDRLLAARDKSGRHAAVAYVYRGYPLLAAVRDFLRQGGLGPVRHVVLTSGQCFPHYRPAYARTYYRDHRTGGGAIQDALTHLVNWVESVIGPADSVLCDGARQVLAGVKVEDTVNVSARHGGILGSYALNQFQWPNETAIQFNAAAGSVRVELHASRWGVFRRGAGRWVWKSCPRPERDTPFKIQAGRFLDQIEGKRVQLCSLEEARQTLGFNLAALESARRGVRRSCRPAGIRNRRPA